VASKSGTLIITGASGFVGRHLLEDLKNDFRIFAIARRSQHECNAPVHSNIAWIRADISDWHSIEKAFREIKTAGGADYLLHLAAFYEFSGEDHPEYISTNVEGTRHVLTLATELNLKLFIFASSVAACSFPEEGEAITESSPPNGEHIYAWSKREGERMIRVQAQDIPSCIVRLGAVYSDWCEYPPLYMFLTTWLSKSWRSKILAGKGMSAIPYIHIRDVVAFFREIIKKQESCHSCVTLNCCTPGCTSHLELYTLATKYYYGISRKPIFMPRFLSGLGLYAMYFLGCLLKNKSFERPWMWRYIDLKLNVDSSQTYNLLGWLPNPRYRIDKRLLFLVERLKSEPFAWQMRNMAALRKATSRPDFNIYTALSDAENEIIDSVAKHIEDTTVEFPHLQSLEKSETYLLRRLNEIILQFLNNIQVLKVFRDKFYDFVSMPLEFAIDEIEYQYQIFQQSPGTQRIQQIQELFPKERSAREQLEETIWNCLVQRK